MHPKPIARAGQSIGLLGGSFDPAHSGHVSITKAALCRFQLDQVWWMLTPHNPLKSKEPAPMGRRKAAAAQIMRHPRVAITDIETRLGTTYTAMTLKRLQTTYPGVRFVWLMGADNLAQFHQWKDWRWIMENVPVGVMARPGDRISARMSKAACIYRTAQLSGRAAPLLAKSAAPAWCFLNVPMSDQSSSDIRARGGWVTPVK